MARGVSRHDEVLKYLKDFHLYHMRMPSYKEIYGNLKIGHGVLHRILADLVDQGKLIKMPASLIPYRFK
jgi:hypothetical protein